MTRIARAPALLLGILGLAWGQSATAAAAELNIYSSRHYQTDEALYAGFAKATGIRINRLGSSNRLAPSRVSQ